MYNICGDGMNKTKQMTTLSMFIALAIIFHWIEAQIPIPSPIPGYHLGLANIVGLVVLYKFNDKKMMVVNLLRSIFASLLNGMIFNYVFWMSFCGVSLSTLISILLKKYSGLSCVGISVASSIAHCVGQILVALVLYNQALMITFLPYLLFMSIPTGIMTGSITSLVLKRLK